MIVYFDTSAFVPLLVSEPGTPVCWRLWRQADAVVSSRLLYVESAAALAQALRLGRITQDGHQAALRSLGTLWLDFEVVEPGWPVVHRAAEMAYECALRGYDAVHCASAELIDEGDLVVASGDRELLLACKSLRISTADTRPTSAGEP